jgi:secondary thiamine-phosphate synthase enzyme
MRTWHKELSFSTKKHREVVDMTSTIVRTVQESGIDNGLLLVQLPHATASLILNEAEGGLVQDLMNKVEELVPMHGGYLHDRIDDNAHAHIKAAIIGSSRALPIVDGEIVRGTWQSFLVLEEDGPRTRRLALLAIGE